MSRRYQRYKFEEIAPSVGSKELFQTSFQNESVLEEQSDDNCTDEETYEEPSLVKFLDE